MNCRIKLIIEKTYQNRHLIWLLNTYFYEVLGSKRYKAAFKLKF